MAHLVEREDFGPQCVELERLTPGGEVVRLVMKYEGSALLEREDDYTVRTCVLEDRGDEKHYIVWDYETRVSVGTRRGEDGYGINVTGIGPWVDATRGMLIVENLTAAMRLVDRLNQERARVALAKVARS